MKKPGTCGTLGLAMLAIPCAVEQYTSSKSLQSAQEIQSNKDQISNEINTIAWKLSEYRVLPKKLGGGNGSFAGSTLSPEHTSTSSGTYHVELQDTLVVIKGSSKQFADASITATFSRNFELGNWRYTGKFE